MIDKLLRPLKDRILAPVVRAIGPRAHPNALSLIGLGAGLASALLAFRGEYPAALGFWILNRVLDGLDGACARAYGRQSDLGGYVDILADFVVYAAIPSAIVVGGHGHGNAYLPLVVLLSSYYVNAASWMYLSAILERRGMGVEANGEQTTVTMPEGLVGGGETAVIYTVFLLAPGYSAQLFWVMAILVGITVLQRLAWAARHLR